MADRIAVNRLVVEVRQGNRPAHMPVSASPVPLVATVIGVDPGRNEVSVELNEYGNPALARVPIRQGNAGTAMPAVGDVVQLEYVNNTVQMVGRQYRPEGSVKFE